jgi:integrase
VPLLGGRVEVQRSLRTADPREAARRAAVVEVGLARRWAALAERGCRVRLDDHEVERLAEEYFERLVAEDRASRPTWRPSGQVPFDAPDTLDPDDFGLQENVCIYWDMLEDERERMLRGDRRSVKEDVEQVAAGRALDDETRERLAFAMQRARMRFLKAMAREWEADFAGEPRAAEARAPSTASGSSASNARTLSQAVEEWTRLESHRWKKNTRDETARALRWFVQLVGGEVKLDTVKRQDVTRFKAVLERVPRGTPAAANVAQFEKTTEGPPKAKARSATTIGKQVARVRDFFAFAVRERWIASNPAAGMVKRHRGRSKREPYTPEDLGRVFGAGFAQWERSHWPARFWIPLLALYTGARRDELAQLLVGDVREVGGVLVLDINEDGEGKSVKSAAGRRKVPVHSQVMELGFGEFVQARRLTGEARLFPDVKRNANGRWGDAMGKWFTRWRRQCGVTSRTQPMHALRNTVVTALLEAGVSRDVVKAVVGHEDDDITSGLYAQAPSPARVRAAVEKLDWREPLAALFERQRS